MNVNDLDWIQCNERLPEKTGVYIAKVNNGETYVDCVYFEDGKWCMFGNAHVVAWCECPEQ